MESNFLHTSIKKDIVYPAYLAARALGVFNKLISGPLFRFVEESRHIFALNKILEDLCMYLDGADVMQAT